MFRQLIFGICDLIVERGVIRSKRNPPIDYKLNRKSPKSFAFTLISQSCGTVDKVK